MTKTEMGRPERRQKKLERMNRALRHREPDRVPVSDFFWGSFVDAYNPLEAKAGLDVVDLRKQVGHRIGFCGNMNVLEWAHSSPEELKAIVLRKLNAAKGGGYIFQSDHSVPSNVSGQNYDYVVRLVRELGRYPLRLGEFDIEDMG